MSEKLEIDALRALVAIDAHGGVTRAAQHLGLSQSAVSHKMRRLERTLDCTLLARRSGGPLLTDAGTRLLEYANRMIALHAEALSDLSKKPLLGTLRLGVTEDATTSAVTTSLGRFARLYPDITLRTRAAQSLCVQDWMDKGEIDVAICQVFTNAVAPTDQILFNDSLHWVKSPDLILPQDKIPFLSFDDQCFYQRWGHSADPRLQTVLECPSAHGIQSAVRAGLGVALLNGMHITDDIEILDDTFPAPPPITFVARSAKMTPPIRALLLEIGRDLRLGLPLRTAI